MRFQISNAGFSRIWACPILLFLTSAVATGQNVPTPPNYTPAGITFDFKDYNPHVNNMPGKVFENLGDVINSRTYVWIYVPETGITISGELKIQRKDANGNWQTIAGPQGIPPGIAPSVGWHRATVSQSVAISTLMTHRTLATITATKDGKTTSETREYRYRHISEPEPAPGQGL